MVLVVRQPCFLCELLRPQVFFSLAPLDRLALGTPLPAVARFPPSPRVVVSGRFPLGVSLYSQVGEHSCASPMFLGPTWPVSSFLCMIVLTPGCLVPLGAQCVPCVSLRTSLFVRVIYPRVHLSCFLTPA